MNTTYTLDAFTLRDKFDNTHIVACMDIVKADGSHIAYEDYIDPETKNDGASCNYEVKDGRKFVVFQRTDMTDVMREEKTMPFHEDYSKSLPSLSGDQKLLCMPRFSTSLASKKEDFDLIDIYDCSDDGFWEDGQCIQRSYEYYLCTLELGPGDFKSFQSVQFSTDGNQFASV